MDLAAKWFLHECTARPSIIWKTHIQPLLRFEKWTLALDGTKFTSISRESLYKNLYGFYTLAYWANKNNTQMYWSVYCGKSPNIWQRKCPVLNNDSTQNCWVINVVWQERFSIKSSKTHTHLFCLFCPKGRLQLPLYVFRYCSHEKIQLNAPMPLIHIHQYLHCCSPLLYLMTHLVSTDRFILLQVLSVATFKSVETN